MFKTAKWYKKVGTHTGLLIYRTILNYKCDF